MVLIVLREETRNAFLAFFTVVAIGQIFPLKRDKNRKKALLVYAI